MTLAQSRSGRSTIATDKARSAMALGVVTQPPQDDKQGRHLNPSALQKPSAYGLGSRPRSRLPVGSESERHDSDAILTCGPSPAGSIDARARRKAPVPLVILTTALAGALTLHIDEATLEHKTNLGVRSWIVP